MTSLPSPSRSIRSSSSSSSSFSSFSWSSGSLFALFPLLMVVAPALFTLGCADKHIGRPCVIGIKAAPDQASVNAQALECPSRICLLPNQEILLNPDKTPTGPLCTDYCSSDDDCAEAEKRGKDPTSTRCIGGFSCRTPIGLIEGNPLACKRVCVCQDFLKPLEPDHKPPTCP